MNGDDAIDAVYQIAALLNDTYNERGNVPRDYGRRDLGEVGRIINDAGLMEIDGTDITNEEE